MNIAVMKETHPGETRVPMVPATVERLVKLGAEVVVESGMGATCRFDDAAYEAVGARVATERSDIAGQRRYRPPPA
jgi:NAD(P) transhydrogenase subunit alpha